MSLRTTYCAFVFALLTLICPCSLHAQTTQPLPDNWISTVSDLAAALTADGPPPALTALLPDESTIQAFDAAQTETRFALAERLNHMSVLTQHCYIGSAQTIVTDIAADLSGNAAVTQQLLHKLVPADPAKIKSADAVAAKWLARCVDPDPNSQLAVILFWDQSAVGPSVPTAPREPVFVLVKARTKGDGISITQVRYGDMGQALR